MKPTSVLLTLLLLAALLLRIAPAQHGRASTGRVLHNATPCPLPKAIRNIMKSMAKVFGTGFVLFMLCFPAGCDLFQEQGERYLEGRMIPGTAAFFSRSNYAPGSSLPKLSPDGNTVAFADLDSLRGGNSLYLLDSSTGTRRFLAQGWNPDWSPDGRWIAYNCGVQICKIRVDGSEPVQLTEVGRNFFPDWSPDGERIAYDRSEADEAGPGGVWIMNADGSEKSFVTGGAYPSWHPDGQRLIMVRGVSQGVFEFVVFDRDARTIEATIQAPHVDDLSKPQYAPHGDRISYPGVNGIWILSADGSNARRILPFHALREKKEETLWASLPSWHPDGEHLVYEHFDVLRFQADHPRGRGDFYQGTRSFYLVHVDSALAVSNLD
jgi:Tol biopolymer transport system component